VPLLGPPTVSPFPPRYLRHDEPLRASGLSSPKTPVNLDTTCFTSVCPGCVLNLKGSKVGPAVFACLRTSVPGFTPDMSPVCDLRLLLEGDRPPPTRGLEPLLHLNPAPGRGIRLSACGKGQLKALPGKNFMTRRTGARCHCLSDLCLVLRQSPFPRFVSRMFRETVQNGTPPTGPYPSKLPPPQKPGVFSRVLTLTISMSFLAGIIC